MSISYQAKGEAQLSQQLKVQELNLVLTSAQANSASAIDLQLVSLTGAAATRAIAVKCGEAVAQIISVSITNQTTGAIVPLSAAPSVASTSNISATIDASSLAAPIAVCVKYVVVE
jgi:hypothetical protein